MVQCNHKQIHVHVQMYVQERSHKSRSGKAYSWQRVYIQEQIKHSIIATVAMGIYM